MPRDVWIVVSRRYFFIGDDLYNWTTFDWLERYARQVDYAADRLDSLEPSQQVGARLREQRRMTVTIPPPADQRDVAAIWALTVAAFEQAVEWADGGRIAITLDHGFPGLVPLAPIGALTMSAEELETLAATLDAGADTTVSPREEVVLALRRTLVDRRGRPRVERVDVMSCSVALTTRGERAIDALARIWGVTVRGLIGDFASIEYWDGKIVGLVTPFNLGAHAPMYRLEYDDRWPDDPRLFHTSPPPSRRRQQQSHARPRP